MGGSTIFQTIWNNYNTAAQAALHSTVGSMIPVVAAAMAGILKPDGADRRQEPDVR